MMTTNFDRSRRADPRQPAPANTSDNDRKDQAYQVQSSADLDDSVAETLLLGDCRLDILGNLRQQMAAHRDRRLLQFFNYWLTLAQTRPGLPDRQSIDPLQMSRSLIPNLFVTEVVYEVGNQPRFRFRLLGQEIIDREDTRPGQYVHELTNDTGLQTLEPHYLDCLNNRIWLRRTSLQWARRQRSFTLYDVLLLPLARDGRHVDSMIGLVLYDA